MTFGEERRVSKLEDTIAQLRAQVRELTSILEKVMDERDSAQFRIRNELEPRLRSEKASYDSWVSEPSGIRAAECFDGKLKDLIDFVNENVELFDWEDADGDLTCKILYLIKNREDDDVHCITEKTEK